jgi:acetyl-CoA acyltransferase 1
MRLLLVRLILVLVRNRRLSITTGGKQEIIRPGAGVESMTFGYGASSQADGWSELVLTNQEAADCLLPMGITSENVASDYGISRASQDTFAAQSFQKAAAAQKAGKFKDEILPIKVKVVDPKTQQEKEVVVDADDGIREGVTAESLAKLKPVFSKTGSTHAGASSQFSMSHIL